MHAWTRVKLWTLLLCCAAASLSTDPAAAQSVATNAVVVMEVEGLVEVLRSGAAPDRWDRAYTNQVLRAGDQLRARENSRALLRMSDLTLQRIGELGYFRVPPEPEKGGIFQFLKGMFYFFHRDKPGQVELETPTVSAVVRGTEFVLQVGEDGTTTLSLIDGAVVMTNQFGHLLLSSGQQGLVKPNQAPVRTTAVIQAINIIQWCLYYPAILDLDELEPGLDDIGALRASLAAYRSGDLLAALGQYPAGRVPASESERVYFAALLQAVGQVDKAEALLQPLAQSAPGRARQLADALGQLAASVRQQPREASAFPVLATEWLAQSYAQQCRSELPRALASAREAIRVAPNFSFGWARVAELEFSFGHTRPARAALARSLELAPRNAQALALEGFLLSADNRTVEAMEFFNRSMAIDGALANAWLGRGLCRIRQGATEAGLLDLEVAAALEPQRSLLRSYLGKAFSHAGDGPRARNELRLAKSLDEQDPTPWFYSALLDQQENRINAAVRELETSQRLNKNRSVYRSRFLLDQDEAVRGANLAQIYQDAGMPEVSFREAARALNVDYANYSAHYFLANSYNNLRDLGRINLRYETAAVSEYLLGNLLAPPGAGTLSPQVTQQEFSRLFDRNRFGFVSSTEYLSRGAWTESAVQYGNWGDVSYAADVLYRSDNGQRPNNDLEQISASLQAKYQMTPQDGMYVQGFYSDTESGDLTQYYDQNRANRGLRVKETQEPMVLAGYHRAWSPESHTLFLAGRLQDTLHVDNLYQQVLVTLTDPATGEMLGPLAWRDPTVPPPVADLHYTSDTVMYTTELQHIWRHQISTLSATLIGGARFQFGTFDTESDLGESSPTQLANDTLTTPEFSTEAIYQDYADEFDRFSVYAYYNLHVLEPLMLTAGLSYDYLYYPLNFRYSPIYNGQETEDQLSPKAGLIWTPFRRTTLRAAYTRSLGGVSFDQSFRLEPTQVAGFSQAYRSLIPESVAGAISAPSFDTYGVALDQKFDTGTYFGAAAELLQSKVDRAVGMVELFDIPVSTPQHLDYEERNFTFTLNQLLGRYFSVGARYRLSHAELNTEFTEIPTSVSPGVKTDVEAILHQVNLYTVFNHPSGVFGSFESLWSQQSNRGYSPDLPGDDFWQFNAFIGYRFPRRQAEIKVGLLNITDRDYQLNPLNLTPDLPRDRTLAASLKFAF